MTHNNKHTHSRQYLVLHKGQSKTMNRTLQQKGEYAITMYPNITDAIEFKSLSLPRLNL